MLAPDHAMDLGFGPGRKSERDGGRSSLVVGLLLRLFHSRAYATISVHGFGHGCLLKGKTSKSKSMFRIPQGQSIQGYMCSINANTMLTTWNQDGWGLQPTLLSRCTCIPALYPPRNPSLCLPFSGDASSRLPLGF